MTDSHEGDRCCYELSFEPAELVKQHSLPDSFNIRFQNGGVQDLDVRWDQASLSASETFAEMVLQGFCMSKLQDSVQLQTVLGALYDQETSTKQRTTERRFLAAFVQTVRFSFTVVPNASISTEISLHLP